ncbi:MAG: rhodanese-like domain-containing protein [Sphingomonadales bacterium]|nr:rhodanese-like domain-containing protein [Sphingomonadales bacterium]MBD3772395.1 rhodanese-like domain-containing protein [Paracoccaceae bacterium]
MIFGFGKPRHKELTANELDSLIREGKAKVVDVREVNEFHAGHIPGAINMPLSTFQASKLPHEEGKMLVLNCQGGVRSAKALDKCAMAEQVVDTHLAGGMVAWARAGLPIER